MEQTGRAPCLKGGAEIEDDVSLVGKFCKGEEEAFDDLVRKHRQRVFNIAFQILRNYEDANEVAQDVFVKVYRNLATFRGESAFTTWLYQIAINLARNRIRYNRRRHHNDSVSFDCANDEGHGQLGPVDPAPTPYKAAVATEQSRLIEQAMNVLSVAHREILILRVIEDLSYEEIAAVLECSLGTVKSRIARARVELQLILRGKMEE